MAVVLNKEDVPSKYDMEQAISRLRRCADLLSKVKSKHYKDEDPESLKKVANFIEMICKKD